MDGDIYQACKVDKALIPRIGYVSIVMDAKATTRDMHLLCTDLNDSSLEEIIQHAIHRIDDFYKEAKALGLWEYGFRGAKRALIHAHLVSLAYTLLDALRRKLLRYSIVKRLLSIETTVEWIRKKAMHLLIYRVRDEGLPIRSILRMIDTI